MYPYNNNMYMVMAVGSQSAPHIEFIVMLRSRNVSLSMVVDVF